MDLSEKTIGAYATGRLTCLVIEDDRIAVL
jgi:hypothetical protein